MKHSSLLAPLVFIVWCNAHAQLPSLDVNPNNQMVKYNDPSNMGRKPIDLSYRDVSGRYLWNDDWNPALIIMKAGNANKLKAVKLNLYTNDIHYLDKDGEMAAPVDKVKRIIVYSNEASDSTKVIGTFDIVADPGTRKNQLVEVMNDGDVQLLKRVSIILKKEPFDPIAGRDEYRFNSSVDYLIRNQATLTPIKFLGKDAVFGAVPMASAHEAWLSSNKNKLKKAEDVAGFFTYLNSQNK